MTERNHSTSARLRVQLADPEPEARRRAVQELPHLPAPESCDLLVTALGDQDWRVRKEAASIAASVEPRTAVVFTVARALAELENIGLRNAAVEALVLIGPDAVPGAIDALSRLDADGRKLAVEVLGGAPTLGGMKALARASQDVDVNVVIAAAEALGKADLAGEEAREVATETLIALLKSPHTAVRVAALDGLRGLGAFVPWAEVEPMLGDGLLRRTVLAAAAGDTSPGALVAFAAAVADPNPSIARAAIASLGQSLERVWDDEFLVESVANTLRLSTAAHSGIRAFAKDPADPQVRGAALLALGLLREREDVPLIVDALADEAVADHAEHALRQFGHDAVGALLVAGRTAAAPLRAATITMLPELAPAEREPLVAVREALGDASPEVLAPALKSLAIIGKATDLPMVREQTWSADPKVAAAAHKALFAIAGRQLSAARELIHDIDPRGDEAGWATTVVDALARGGQSTAADRTFLEGALTHRDASVRRAAIEALAVVGGDDAAQAVTDSLADEERVVAFAAIRALGHLGRAEQLASLAASTRDSIRLGAILRALRDADPERAFAAARPLLRSPEAAIAAAAVEIVGSTTIPGHHEALLSATDHPDTEVVKLALSEITKLGEDYALTALASAIDHAAESVRKCAAELLGQCGGEGETMLRSRLDRERSADVRFTIMQALAARRTVASG